MVRGWVEGKKRFRARPVSETGRLKRAIYSLAVHGDFKVKKKGICARTGDGPGKTSRRLHAVALDGKRCRFTGARPR